MFEVYNKLQADGREKMKVRYVFLKWVSKIEIMMKIKMK